MKKPAFLLLLLFFANFSFGQIAEEIVPSGKEFRIAFQGGYAYRIAPLSKDTPPLLKNYANDLKSGYSIGLDAAYFFRPSWGLGMKYSRFGSEGAVPNMSITYDDGTSAYGNISDNISISFVGPSYVSKFTFANPDHVVFGGMSLGYLGYRDDAVLANRTIEITGATFGAAVDLGYDYAISKYITVGAQASVTGGALNKLTVVENNHEITLELDEQSRENLSRLDLSAGVRVRI